MKRRPTCALYGHIACLILLSTILSSCDDAFIDPFSNDEKYFTLYGFLDQSNNFKPGATHNIRVSPITRRPEQIESPNSPQADLDGRVFLTDLNTELSVEMYHSLDEIQPGVFGHIFRTSLFIQPGHRYRLEIQRTDGIITFAETRVPSVSSLSTIKKNPQLIENEASVVQELVLAGVESLWNLDIIYYTGSCFSNSANIISYGRVGRTGTEGWRVNLNITEDMNTIRERLQTASVNLCAMGLRAQIIDDQWILPEGELNLDEVSLPQNLTNVENGYGFLGSVGLFQDDWQLDQALSDLVN